MTDEAAGALTFTIGSALARDLIGQEPRRRHEVSGDRLVPLPADPSEGFRVTREQQQAARDPPPAPPPPPSACS